MRRSEGGGCPACGELEREVFFALTGVPALASRLWKTREEARLCPRGDIHLTYCPGCGLVFNSAFRRELVECYEDYENSLHFSQVFQAYSADLVERLVERYGLFGKTVVEIGCGTGDFLAALCRRGRNRGYGFDVAAGPRDPDVGTADLVFVKGEFTDAHAAIRPDLLCCRQVLEHLDRPLELLRSVRETLRASPGSVAYFEVPNAARTFAGSTWDIVYEHCLHFTAESLSRLFLGAGFDIIEVRENYDGQFLAIEVQVAEKGGRRGTPVSPEGSLNRTQLTGFLDVYAQRLAGARQALNRASLNGLRVALWGAGARAVSLLNALAADERITFVVDINPRKHARFVAGTGHEIFGPDALRRWQPAVILLVNPIYQGEIARMAGELGLTASLECV